jgi:hypothetical protein
MNNDNSASIVSKVWNYARVLKNAGVGYGDYVEQITYLRKQWEKISYHDSVVSFYIFLKYSFSRTRKLDFLRKCGRFSLLLLFSHTGK